MKRSIIVALLLVVSIAAANAFGLGLGKRFGKLGVIAPGGTATPPPPLTNLRITNTGAFRITNTGDNRAVFP